MREGLAAASLLANDDFRTLVHSLMFEGYATFTETKPDQAREREDIYNLIQGLKAIEAELNHRIANKDEIERRVNAEDDAEHDESALINDNELGD